MVQKTTFQEKIQNAVLAYMSSPESQKTIRETGLSPSQIQKDYEDRLLFDPAFRRTILD